MMMLAMSATIGATRSCGMAIMPAYELKRAMKIPRMAAMSSIRLAPSPTRPVIGSTKIRATKETLITTVIIATTEEVIRLGKNFWVAVS